MTLTILTMTNYDEVMSFSFVVAFHIPIYPSFYFSCEYVHNGFR